MKSKTNKELNYLNVFIIYIATFLALWILPFLFGKYADSSFPFVAKDDVFHELVGLLGPTESTPWCSFDNFDVDVMHNWQTYKNSVNLGDGDKKVAKKLGISFGGVWQPPDCKSRYEVVIIVPYRNRAEHLKKFMHYMHPYLQAQKLHYRIVVIEQTSNGAFNRGKLFNIGFVEVNKLGGPNQCIIFHDVDLLPLNPWNIYACTHQPRHMYSAVDIFRFHLPYRRLFGGAIAMQSIHFKKVNGFSNIFDGWGGEDDDLYSRLEERGMQIIRFDPAIATYAMLPHHHAIPSPERWDHLSDSLHQLRNDGLSTLSYSLRRQKLTPLYTHYLIHL